MWDNVTHLSTYLSTTIISFQLSEILYGMHARLLISLEIGGLLLATGGCCWLLTKQLMTDINLLQNN